jgi:hypothetical protein
MAQPAGLVADYGNTLARAVTCFMDDFEACIVHRRSRHPPARHPDHKSFRTLVRRGAPAVEGLSSTPLEDHSQRLGEKAVLKLMFGAMIRASERWHSIRITEFRRRQMAAVKQGLDEE